MRCRIVLLAWLLLIPTLAPAHTLFIGSQDPFGGAGVFNAKGCVKCHAINGVGGKIGLDLAFIADPRSERERTPRPVFRGEEVADLVASLRSLKRAN